MVNLATAKQFEGFDFNEYVFVDSSAVLPLNGIGILIPGAVTNASALGVFMAALANPPAGPGPQFPWPYHGLGPSPAAQPVNVAEVQRTLFRVVTNDMNVFLFDLRLVQALVLWLGQNPDAVPLGPSPVALGGGGWPMPGPVLLEAAIGMYEFERKWMWLFHQRAAADADSDLHVYMEG